MEDNRAGSEVLGPLACHLAVSLPLQFTFPKGCEPGSLVSLILVGQGLQHDARVFSSQVILETQMPTWYQEHPYLKQLSLLKGRKTQCSHGPLPPPSWESPPHTAYTSTQPHFPHSSCQRPLGSVTSQQVLWECRERFRSSRYKVCSGPMEGSHSHILRSDSELRIFIA